MTDTKELATSSELAHAYIARLFQSYVSRGRHVSSVLRAVARGRPDVHAYVPSLHASTGTLFTLRLMQELKTSAKRAKKGTSS